MSTFALMRILRCVLFFSTLIPVSAQTNAPAANVSPAPLPNSSGIQTVVFGQGGGHDLHALFMAPKEASGPAPAIIYVHGGGWFKGSPASAPLGRIAMRGYFAVSIEYRLSAVAQWPAQIEDCKCAVRWLRANAAKYNVDPSRIGAWGDSAGGHLVACLGTMDDQKQFEGDGGNAGVSSAVQAVVDYYGPTDFTDPKIYSPDAIKFTERLFGKPYDADPALWKSGSPLFYVKPGDPPFLLVHGDMDNLVPIAQSNVFDAALTKAGVPHQLVVVKNAGHGFSPASQQPVDPNPRQILNMALDFFDKNLKGAPTAPQ